MTPKRSIIPVFIPHAGCEHECVFCNQHRITGAAAPIIESGKLVIEDWEADNQPAELAFYGGSFTAISVEMQDELLNAAQPFLKRNCRNSIRISTRPDCIDELTIKRLRNYGVKTVELGAQSMCDDVLLKSQRGHTSSDVARAAELVKNGGLALILQMMTGLPGDTSEKSLYTAGRFVELKPDGVRIYPTVIVRGTMLHEMWERGEYQEHSIECAVELCVELCTIFERAGIPIIRLGLNPSDTLSSGDAVAGAYHPAFGELVYSRIYYNKAVTLLENIPSGSEVTLAVAAGCVSIMTGQRRCNITALMSRFSLRSIKVIEIRLNPGESIRLITPSHI